MKTIEKAFTFDDVALVPQFNNINSRTEPDLSSWVTTKTKVGMPIIPANMDTVIGDELANKLLARGGFPIFHRFTEQNKQIEWADKYGRLGNSALSIGLIDLDIPYAENVKMHFIEKLIVDHGVQILCIDVAHGHCKKMLEQIDWLKRTWPEIQVIAGNVCTPMAYGDLVNAGADAVKVGIGPGAACTTRIVTGFGVPQFSAIARCADVAEKLRVPLIADGGIRNSRDVVLALAAGASTVMVGKLFAMTYESASVKIWADQKCYSTYRGQASAEFQNNFYGKVKEGTVPEGVMMSTEITRGVDDLLDDLLGGLRSGLTYGGARSIKELQRKAEFVEVTSTYMVESNPRK